MKKYDITILNQRPEDSLGEQFSEIKAFRQDAEDLLKYICVEGKIIARNIKSKHDEPDEVFSLSYKNCYFCLGLSRIFGLKKLAHILEINEFILDYGRHKQDFSRHSMTYLVELIFETSEKILEEFIKNDFCDYDTSDIINECKTYLEQPLDSHNAEIDSSIMDIAADNMGVVSGDILSKSFEEKVDTHSISTFDDIGLPPEIDDQPEYLNFSEDKLLLVNDFCDEAADNLDEVETTLIELEGNEGSADLINQAFRSIHTVKGGARLLEVSKIEALAHQMESLLDDIRSQKISVDALVIDTLMDGKTALSNMIIEVRNLEKIETKINQLAQQIFLLRTNKNNISENFNNTKMTDLVSVGIDKIVNSTENTKIQEADAKDDNNNKKTDESIRVPAGKLDELLNTASEVFINRIRLQNDTQLLSNSIMSIERLIRDGKFDKVAGSLEWILEKCSELELYLITSNSEDRDNSNKGKRTLDEIKRILQNSTFRNLENFSNEAKLRLLRVEEIRRQLKNNVDNLEGLSTRLQTGAMGFRMVPMSQLFNRFPAQVRELSRKIGKKTRLTISGAETELDKILINQLADPLVHIMRNSIDHGFESRDERISLGKNETGEIKISAFYHGSNAIIEVSDDGSGINRNKVLEQAQNKNIVTKDEANELSDQQVLNLIFTPGLSTAEVVTELSGRGVGMDVVKTSVTAVQGSVHIESIEGRGTTVSMKLPLTLAIVGILIVSENGHQFAFPVLNVVEVLSIKRNELKRVGQDLVLNYRGTTLNINLLSNFFGFPPSTFKGEEYSIIVITDGARTIGIMVDKIKGRQDVLTKQFGSLLDKIDYMMGCTILSDGSLVLILDIWKLLTVTVPHQIQIISSSNENDLRIQRSAHKILVVDDSAIQRTRMSSILDQAGYLVETAIDGHDALQKTIGQEYSAFCVDIIMPLMDGYEFIEKLRESAKHSSSTVFMITGKTITEGAEKRRIESLGISKVFEKPVPEKDLIYELDSKCLPSQFQKGDQ